MGRLVGVSAAPFTYASHVLGVAAAVLVLIWCIHFRGGLAFEATNKNLIFNSYPDLMSGFWRVAMYETPFLPEYNTICKSFLQNSYINQLQLYDLVELKVQGDGNCQFRALSDQFYRTPEHHKFVRQQVINQIKSHPENYEGYVPMAYNDYLKKLSKSGEWGDHVTLQAAADSYGVKIFVITSFKDTCYIEILPSEQRSKRVIFLSFWAEVHYNSIYPEGDQPTSETTKKRWWHFGNKH